jgi:hypothetical protein
MNGSFFLSDRDGILPLAPLLELYYYALARGTEREIKLTDDGDDFCDSDLTSSPFL